MPQLTKGIFITFEGPEGCGKSTQVYKVTEALQAKGFEVVATREPGGTAIGQQIREVLLNPDNVSLMHNTEVLMFAADRVQHLEEKIRPALEQKKVVLCDRYVDSTTAYQIGGRSIKNDLIESINKISTEGLMPELTLLFDIPVAEGLKRATQQDSDRFEKELISFHERVREKYLTIAEQDPERIKKIDGLLSIEKVHKEVMRYLEPLLKKYVL